MRKIAINLVLVVFVATAACYAQRLVAQDNYLDAKTGQTVFIGNETKTQGQTNGNACELSCCGQDSCDNGCSDFPLACSCYPGVSIAAGFGIDSFHGVSDAVTNNFGAVTSLNSGMPVPGLSDYGIGWQLGMSYGVYDWDGRTTANFASTQQQTFVTTGFFHKAQQGQRLSYGVVYDWMFNDNWGAYAYSPTLGQWRGQIEYALSNRNAVGVYGTLRDKSSSDSFHIEYNTYDRYAASINQVDIFWHHKFDMGADSRLWFGVPEHDRYSSYDIDPIRSGTLLDWIIGAQVEVPLSENLALIAGGQYGHPTSSANSTAPMMQYYDVNVGVVWYIGGHAKKASINGDCWQPYMPVANNSTFLVKQSASYAIP